MSAPPSTLFRPATRQKCRLRMAIDGVAGSGKTFTALRFATMLGKRIAVINTESGAVEKYLGLSPDGTPWQFDVGYLPDFSPTSYTQAILQAGQGGYDVLIIDSLSHAWAGVGGALELKDKKAEQTHNSFTAWKDVTPMHNRMVEAILHSPCHVIVTMRSKTDYVLETDSKGKQAPRKVGMEPVQRYGMEYEFDIYGSIDQDHVLKISKSRCPEVADAVVVKPSAEFIRPVCAWLNDGSDIPASFFAVTDDDLAKFDARQKAEEKAEQAKLPRKSAMELIQEAAAKAGSPAASPATVATPPEEANGVATREQIDRLTTIYTDLGRCVEMQDAIKAKFKIGSLRSLTNDQAAGLLAKAEAAWAKRQQEASAAASSIVPPAPSTNEQQAEIQELFKQYMQVDPTAALAFRDKLQAVRGTKGALKTLSHADAERLKGAFQHKQLANFFDVSLQTWQPASGGESAAATANQPAGEAASG